MVALRIPTIALLGNPNTGKTTLFNALAGMNQRVGNYPGVTVETKKGKLHHGDLAFDLIDLPGTYSLAPRSPDEMLAVDVILGNNPNEPRPDVVVTIVDASNLERNLYLMTQVLELGVPVVVALNMIDVAAGQGLKIDVDKLSQQLGVPVVPLQANKGKGLEQLKAVIANSLDQPACADGPAFPQAFEHEVAGLQAVADHQEPLFLMRRLLLDVGGHAEKRLTEKYGHALAEALAASRARLVQAGLGLARVETHIRYGWIRKALTGCIQRPAKRLATWTDRIDRVLTHRFWGTLIFLAIMFLVFTSIFVIADYPMKWIDEAKSWLADLVGGLMSAGPMRSLLVDGIINGVGAVVKFVPQIMILFAIIAVLEDCGYMARAAFLMDRLMSRAGLNGKSFIPLLSSMACAVPGILSARVIENPRDRLATILVAPLMSCSARLPVYTLLIRAFLPESEYGLLVPVLVCFGLYMIGIVLAPLIAFVLKRTLLRGETPVFVMEMPLYKCPSWKSVLRRSMDSGWMFLKRVGTMILASMVVVWAALYYPHSNYDTRIAVLEESIADQRDEIKVLKASVKNGDDAEAKAKLQKLLEDIEPTEKQINVLHSEWKGQSILGRIGHVLEPVVEPLGWDWRIGMAALASFPAREVMVGTLGIIFGEGEGEADDEEFRSALRQGLVDARRDGQLERRVFSVPVALSVLVFFALCCQCVSTLVIIKRETGSWRWPIFTFVYMTLLAYLGAMLTFHIGQLFT